MQTASFVSLTNLLSLAFPVLLLIKGGEIAAFSYYLHNKF